MATLPDERSLSLVQSNHTDLFVTLLEARAGPNFVKGGGGEGPRNTGCVSVRPNPPVYRHWEGVIPTLSNGIMEHNCIMLHYKSAYMYLKVS